MKQIIFMILLLSSLTLAIYGGETEVLYSENCSKAFVNITAEDEIIPGEFYLSDNCIFDSEWIYNCSCNKNITFTLKSNAINNYTISTDYTIQVESDLDVSDIKILNDDIIVTDISYTTDTLELTLSGEGTKEVMIKVPKCPYKLYIDGIETEFICSDNIVRFDLSFSEHTIKMTFSVPSTTTGSGGSGGSSYSSDQEDDVIKPNKTDWRDYYDDVGGEQDEHGCYLMAGYQWCESKQKCLRDWEEECSEDAADEEETIEEPIVTAEQESNAAGVGTTNTGRDETSTEGHPGGRAPLYQAG